MALSNLSKISFFGEICKRRSAADHWSIIYYIKPFHNAAMKRGIDNEKRAVAEYEKETGTAECTVVNDKVVEIKYPFSARNTLLLNAAKNIKSFCSEIIYGRLKPVLHGYKLLSNLLTKVRK